VLRGEGSRGLERVRSDSYHLERSSLYSPLGDAEALPPGDGSDEAAVCTPRIIITIYGRITPRFYSLL